MDANTIQEYELTYLARSLPPGIKDQVGVEMLDGYFPEDRSVHPRLRLRRQGTEYQLTKKVPLSKSDASSHSETTISLELVEYEGLRMCTNRIIEKTRYKVEHGDWIAEVDVFGGQLQGLVLVDFEFNSHGEMAGFVPPNYCLADVTQEEFIAGGLLAGKTYEEISGHLDRFGYEKL